MLDFLVDAPDTGPLVTVQFATQVLRLRRQNQTVAAIARQLGRTESEVLGAHPMLGVGVGGETIDVQPRPSAEERVDIRARMPKRNQDRVDSGRHGGAN